MLHNKPDIIETERQLINAFACFDNWEDRYVYLIDLGKKLPEFDEEWKTEEYFIHGCQSQVWFRPEFADHRLHFDATSDSAIVSGLIYILLAIYSDRTPKEILTTEPDFIREIGFNHFISPTRANGLAAMLHAIKQHATQHAHHA